MCIRHAFHVAIADTLADETFIEPRDRDDAIALMARLPDATFAHPLALARQFTKRGFVDDDVFGACASAIGPAVRGYRRLRKFHGDLFAGTPAALPSIEKERPIVGAGYKRLARRTRSPRNLTLPRKYRRPRGPSEPQKRRMLETFVAAVVTANEGTPRAFGANVIDLVALRASRARALTKGRSRPS